MKTIKEIAEDINAAAGQFQMGNFQEIRCQIQNKKRVKDHRIFTPQTIKEKYAYNSGGRTELQFNIGNINGDPQWFRFGVAFSLEPSQTLPKPLILKPKILKLNEFLCNNSTEFEDLIFWIEGKPLILPIGPIPDEAIRLGNFLFWGKICPRESVDPNTVLFLFDRLLTLYRYVEGGQDTGIINSNLKNGFLFKPGCTEKAETTVWHSRESAKEVTLRHNEMQSVLHKVLCQKFGVEKVGAENDTGRGSRIDLVFRDGTHHVYYEIKPYPSLRICIREAIGQLLEYSYWPGGNIADRLVIVSDNPLTPDAAHYLNVLRTKFNLPVDYQRLDMSTGVLHEPQ